MPAQVNATLTLVQAATTGEAFDGPAAPGAVKWTVPAGQAANAYLKTRRRRVTTAAGSDVVLERTLIVDASSPGVEWLVGDFVTFARTGGAAEVVEVETVEESAIDDPAFSADLVTVRLALVAG